MSGTDLAYHATRPSTKRVCRCRYHARDPPNCNARSHVPGTQCAAVVVSCVPGAQCAAVVVSCVPGTQCAAVV
eukprot:19387-Rhodomonas_salina.4